MKIALFGGSFDPVHQEHVRLVGAAIGHLGLDKAIVIPARVAPHKIYGAVASGEERLEMCKIAFRNLPRVEISPFELESDGTSYSYLTCEHFKKRYPQAELFFLVGADMLENFFTWKFPERILACATLVACGRGGERAEGLREKFRARFGCDYRILPFTGEAVSSTRLRTALAFGKAPAELDGEVCRYARERGIYSHPAILPALALEKEERREHSYRVAKMATERARSLGVSERKALLASALHDCAKYVPPDSPLLKGFVPPEGVPAPVLHQYTGAYLAEHTFGISDEEVLDAIRFHTSGRENMTALGKLVFLADMLEEGRSYEGVEELRRLFFEDLDVCLYAALKRQTEYLAESGKPVYPLTQSAFLWAKGEFEDKAKYYV